MNKPKQTTRPSWMRWFDLRRTKERESQDFADYGTAFGLDLSMAASIDQLERIDQAPASDATTSQPIMRARQVRTALG